MGIMYVCRNFAVQKMKKTLLPLHIEILALSENRTGVIAVFLADPHEIFKKNLTYHILSRF